MVLLLSSICCVFKSILYTCLSVAPVYVTVLSLVKEYVTVSVYNTYTHTLSHTHTHTHTHTHSHTHTHTVQCPDASDIDSVGICGLTCMINSACPEGQYCCENSCGGTVCNAPEVQCRGPNGDFVSAGESFMIDCNTW